MRKILIFGLLAIAMSWCGCHNDCTDCEDYTRTLALYVKVQGTAKDSILNIEGNIYNEITGYGLYLQRLDKIVFILLIYRYLKT